MKTTAKNFLTLVIIFSALLIVVAFISPLTGSIQISAGEFVRSILHPDKETISTIIMKSRIPRTLLAIFAGAGLATSGAVLQPLLKNPLADPFTLGIASGGSLGASVWIIFGKNFPSSFFPLTVLSSIIGAIITLIIILAAARRIGLSSSSIILAGISINIMATSAIMILQYVSDISQSHLIVRWLMGELDVWGISKVIPVIITVIPGVIVSCYISIRLNHLMTGQLLASSRGINIQRMLITGVVVTSIMTGAIVSVCGPIGFVGLVVPHLIRIVSGYDNRSVIPLSALAGALLLLLCDSIARTIFAPAELPIGIFTSLIGGTALISLLAFKRSSMGL